MLSSPNVFEISDIQDDETEAPVQAAPNVTMLYSVQNSSMEFLRTTTFFFQQLAASFCKMAEWRPDDEDGG